jgi:hypothetical protein
MSQTRLHYVLIIVILVDLLLLLCDLLCFDLVDRNLESNPFPSRNYIRASFLADGCCSPGSNPGQAHLATIPLFVPSPPYPDLIYP